MFTKKPAIQPTEANLPKGHGGASAPVASRAPDSAAADAAAHEAAGPLPIDGRYQLQELIGRGAMGDVWMAHDIIRREKVAIKVLREGLEGQDYIARFWREARILTRIVHPNVIQLYGYGTEPMPYIVMQLLTGQDLSRLLSNWKTLPISHAADIFHQVAMGVAHVHEAGVIHRDIKPGNIFCVAGGPVKVVDFGLSKKEHALSTSRVYGSGEFSVAEGTLLGTVRYMSPEQLLGIKVDYRVDLWAMAVVLFKMVTGTDAFDAATEMDLMVKIIKSPPPLPSRLGKDLPRSLDDFFARALHKRLDSRFASATEMAEAFSAIARSVVKRRPLAREE